MGNLEGTLSPSCVCDKNKYVDKDDFDDDDDAITHLKPVDSRLPLTEMQLFKLKKSWKGIHREMIPTGVEMFIRLFRGNSQLRDLFTDFNNINNDEELRQSELLENHGLLVMTALDEAIQSVDDLDRMISTIQRIGATHIRFAAFYGDLFHHMEHPFLEAVKQTLGDRYSEQMDTIYRVVIKFILSTLEQGFKEAKGTGNGTVRRT